MNRADDLYSSIRSVDSIGTRSLAGGNAPHMSGVGIFFQQESDGKVYVNTIVSGGSAERNGRVRVGDVMCSVDGRDVIGEPVSVLRSLLLGHEGSNVVLTFARAVEPGEADHEGGTVIAKFDVELPRGSPEYFARVDVTRRYEAEMQDLRYQLKTTLGEEKEVAEEVERVKRVLQLERGASARREKVPVPLRAPAATGVWGAHAAPCMQFCSRMHMTPPLPGAGNGRNPFNPHAGGCVSDRGLPKSRNSSQRGYGPPGAREKSCRRYDRCASLLQHRLQAQISFICASSSAPVEDLLFQLQLSVGRFPQIRLPAGAQGFARGPCFMPRVSCSGYMSACRGAGTNEREGQATQGVCRGVAQAPRGGGLSAGGTVGQGAACKARGAGGAC